MPKTHLGDGVYAERLADGRIRLTTYRWEFDAAEKEINLWPDAIAALSQFAKEND